MAKLRGFMAAMALLSPVSRAKEMPVDVKVKAALYDSRVIHQEIVSMKLKVWGEFEQAGLYDTTQYKALAVDVDFVACKNGVAAYAPGPKTTFKCNNVDLYDFKPHNQLGNSTGQGAGSWGWTSPDGREFVALGQRDGTAFAEIKAGKLVYLGRLPPGTDSALVIWREIKGYKNYVVIGSEAYNADVQIFDMSKLLTIDPTKPVKFDSKADLTGRWNELLPSGRSHNVVVNEEKNYGVAVGVHPPTGPLRGGLAFFDLTDPSKPKTLGGTGMDGYVHDAQCIVYRGPDTKYQNRDICYGYDENSLTIFDVSDKKNISIISNTSYTGVSYTHQGWVLDPNWQQFLIMDDEYDEVRKTGLAAEGYPIAYIWDISSLEKPKQTGHYKATRKGIDHNQYVKDGFAYQSNYGLGLTILDLRSVPQDPTGKGIREAGFFDTYPEDDSLPGGGNITFTGSWSNYPFFKSGFIVINTIDRGVFVVKQSTPA